MAKEALITWKEGWHFEGCSSGHTIQIDAPIPTGTDLGINPMSLLLAPSLSVTENASRYVAKRKAALNFPP